MKNLAFGFLFMSSLAMANDVQVSVKNFNFSYTDPHGEGTATSFSRMAEVKVSVDKLDKDFKLTVSGAENAEFELKDAPSFMTEAQKMVVKGFNLDFSTNANLSLVQATFTSADDNLKLDNLTLACNRQSSQSEVMDQLILGCIQKMSLRTTKFSSQAEETLVSALVSAMDDGKGNKAAISVNSLSLNSASGKFDLAAEVKAQVSGKVKGSGTVSYDATSGKLTLKISEVKFGFLNITGKVFDELKKKESEKLTVREPYVYYSVK